MKLKYLNYLSLSVLLVLVALIGCNNTDDLPMADSEEEELLEVAENPQGEVSFLNKDLVYDGYVLVVNKMSNRVYLMDKLSDLIFNWPLNLEKLGNDAFLLPSGNLLAMFQVEEAKIKFGGFGGKIQLIDKEGNIEWDFSHSTEDYNLHHDAEMLPNGNVLIQTWERKTLEEVKNAGSNMDIELFPDGLIEVDPKTNQIVWEWHVWDHLVQDFDDTKENFGDVANSPHRIDLNYIQNESGDITHANGLAYDADKDLIYLSVNFYHEVWVIDHSTSTAEAALSEGGNYNKGGDLIYRFGNPEAYKNTMGERRFFNNHHPNPVKNGSQNTIFVFTNGNGFDQSTVFEFEIPSPFKLRPNEDNEPTVKWSFTDPDLYSGKVSGAVPLPNGNVLITEGDYGLWEVTRAGEVVWKFNTPGFYWRAYHFDKDAPEIEAIGL